MHFRQTRVLVKGLRNYQIESGIVKTLLMLITGYCGLPTAVLADDQASNRPNIVIVMADDMGFSDIGSFGSEIATPNLDRLATAGLRLTQFYNTPRCAPTRAALLTGLYSPQAGMGHNPDGFSLARGVEFPSYLGDLREETATIAEILRANGYSTYMAGKWHLTTHMGQWADQKRPGRDLPREDFTSRRNWPLQRGFDRFYGIIGGASSFYNPSTLVNDNDPVQASGDGYYFTEALNDRAVAYIREHFSDADDQPLFLYLAHTAPHWPLHATPEMIERQSGNYAEGWDRQRELRYQRLVQLGIVSESWPLTPRDPRVPAWASLSQEKREWYERAMEVYAAQIQSIDAGIGKLVEELERHDQLDNTLILFFSDNGGSDEEILPSWNGIYIPLTTRDGRTPLNSWGTDRDVLPGPEVTYQSYGPHWANVSNTPFHNYKVRTYEGGISSPFIAHWPARITNRGMITSARAHVVDVLPTLLDVAAIDYPESIDGRSILPHAGESFLSALLGLPHERGPIYWEHEGHRAVRDGRWKLVSMYSEPWELYDMHADRVELNDLAAVRTEVVRRMSAMHDAWAKSVGVMPWDTVSGGK